VPPPENNLLSVIGLPQLLIPGSFFMKCGMSKSILRKEMVRRAITYEALAALLCEAEEVATSASVRKKLSRGSFKADFFLAALSAMGVSIVEIQG
jgi:hypothetical protein